MVNDNLNAQKPFVKQSIEKKMKAGKSVNEMMLNKTAAEKLSFNNQLLSASTAKMQIPHSSKALARHYGSHGRQ